MQKKLYFINIEVVNKKLLELQKIHTLPNNTRIKKRIKD